MGVRAPASVPLLKLPATVTADGLPDVAVSAVARRVSQNRDARAAGQSLPTGAPMPRCKSIRASRSSVENVSQMPTAQHGQDGVVRHAVANQWQPRFSRLRPNNKKRIRSNPMRETLSILQTCVNRRLPTFFARSQDFPDGECRRRSAATHYRALCLFPGVLRTIDECARG